MKYIKTFESNILDYKCYWLLPTDERFKKSLTDINMSEEQIKRFLYNNTFRELKYVFISYDPYHDPAVAENFKWGWNPYEGKIYNDFFEKHNYKFMGTVNIDDTELEMYEIELNADKFNL